MGALRPIIIVTAAMLIHCCFALNALAQPRFPDKFHASKEAALSPLATSQATLKAGSPRAVPRSAKLMTVPLLVPGKIAYVSVVQQGNVPLSNVSVKINDTFLTTDNHGRASVEVPNSETVSFSIYDSQNNLVSERVYRKHSEKLLVASDLSAQLLEHLDKKNNPENSAVPVVLYSPLVIQIGNPFLVIGKNLSGNPGECKIMVDGMDMPTLAGSPVSILAMASNQLAPGPVRELSVSRQEEESEAQEIDICRIEYTIHENKLEVGKDYRGGLQVIGTNMPCLVEVANGTPEAVKLSLETGLSVPSRSCFVTPGGVQNSVIVIASIKQDVPLKIDTKLMPEIVGTRGYLDTPEARVLAKQLITGEMIRLLKRQLALDARINKLNDIINSPSPQITPNTKRMDERMKSKLIERLNHLKNMLETRHAIFDMVGGTENEYARIVGSAKQPDKK